MNQPDPAFFKRMNKRRQPERSAAASGRIEESVLRPVLMRTEDFLRAMREAAHASSATLSSSTQREPRM